MAEHALKIAERNFARDMFERATVNASRPGVALYSDKRALIGKPVTLGERIMQIADPEHVEVVIEVAVGDAIVLKSGARANVFLDSDPIRPREARVEFADYEAHVRPGNTLAFRVVAQLSDSGGERPRLGVRGTAQLYGECVPLAFYLFRRPLSALRQWIGL
jgi:HlyD family secretion protein